MQLQNSGIQEIIKKNKIYRNAIIRLITRKKVSTISIDTPIFAFLFSSDFEIAIISHIPPAKIKMSSNRLTIVKFFLI